MTSTDYLYKPLVFINRVNNTNKFEVFILVKTKDGESAEIIDVNDIPNDFESSENTVFVDIKIEPTNSDTVLNKHHFFKIIKVIEDDNDLIVRAAGDDIENWNILTVDHDYYNTESTEFSQADQKAFSAPYIYLTWNGTEQKYQPYLAIIGNGVQNPLNQLSIMVNGTITTFPNQTSLNGVNEYLLSTYDEDAIQDNFEAYVGEIGNVPQAKKKKRKGKVLNKKADHKPNSLIRIEEPTEEINV